MVHLYAQRDTSDRARREWNDELFWALMDDADMRRYVKPHPVRLYTWDQRGSYYIDKDQASYNRNLGGEHFHPPQDAMMPSPAAIEASLLPRFRGLESPFEIPTLH